MVEPKHFAFKQEYDGIATSLVTTVSIGTASVLRINKPEDFVPAAALWDTGATHTVITPKLVRQLGLIPIDKMTVSGVNSTEVVNVYVVDIILPNNLMIPNIRVAESEFVGGEILIGMNIIQYGDFAIANAHGKTHFSFCIPAHDEPICLYEKTLEVDKI